MTVVLLHFRNLFIIADETRIATWQRVLLSICYPFYAGGEAVVLFFVMSGFVLMLPYLKNSNQSYGIFVVRRVLRIYIPYLFALALAVLGAALWHGPHGMQAWGDDIWSTPVRSQLVIQHVLMLGIYDWHQYNPAFWTLIEEMRIALIYPWLVYVCLRLPAKWALLLAASLALAARGAIRIWPTDSMQSILTLEYVGIFICGILLAKNFSTVSEWYRNRRTPIRVLLAFSALTCYLTAHLIRHAADWFFTLASAALIVVALVSRRADKLLSLGAIRYLGRISYSLYLVHFPVLFGLGIYLHRRISPGLILPIYLCAAIVAASGFYLLVEAPFISISRRVARVKVSEG